MGHHELVSYRVNNTVPPRSTGPNNNVLFSIEDFKRIKDKVWDNILPFGEEILPCSIPKRESTIKNTLVFRVTNKRFEFYFKKVDRSYTV